MHKCSSPLYIVFHILLYILTQAIMHTYLTHKPQAWHVSSNLSVSLSLTHTRQTHRCIKSFRLDSRFLPRRLRFRCLFSSPLRGTLRSYPNSCRPRSTHRSDRSISAHERSMHFYSLRQASRCSLGFATSTCETR